MHGNRLSKCVIFLAFLVGYFLAALDPQVAKAACGCQLGSNQIYVLGYEFIAKSCPPTPPSETTDYTYIINAINCMGAKITQYAPYGDMSGTPASITSFYISRGYRILRNPSGTHFIVVQNGTYPFTGSVAGVSIAGKPAGVYYTDPPEGLNELCTSVPLPDQDGDRFPDCLDCNANDAGQNAECLSEPIIEMNLGPMCPLP